mgnify:CR=1 FL=1
MEVLTNDLELNESEKKVFASVLGKMVEEFFTDEDNLENYKKQKSKLTEELTSLEKKRKEVKEANEAKRNSSC